jgi:hypothetical protein
MTESGKAMVCAIPKILKTDSLEVIEFDEGIRSSVNHHYGYRGKFNGLALDWPWPGRSNAIMR